MTQISGILSQFRTDLGRANDLLGLIDSFRQFAASPVARSGGDGDGWPEAARLASIAPQVRTDLPILSGAILLYVCGRFEYFIRELVVAMADELVSRAPSFDKLPERVQQHVRVKSLEVAQNPSKFQHSKAEAEAILVSLAQNLTDASTPGPFTIASRVLTITESNMNPGTLSEVLKRVDVTDLWSELGKQARLRAHLGVRIDKDCSNAAQADLESIMKERNGVAHPTGSTTFPGPDRVREVVDFFGVLAEVIVDVATLPR